jgi:hypothetical protein
MRVNSPYLVGWKVGQYHARDKKRKQVFTLPQWKNVESTFREKDCTNSRAEAIPFCGDLLA